VGQSEDVTIKILIDNLLRLVRLLFTQWLKILVIITLVGYITYSQYSEETTTYTAKTVFSVSSVSGEAGGLSDFLGRIGLGGRTQINAQQVIGIGRSSSILSKVLLSKSSTSNRILANQIIDKYDLTENWKEIDPIYESFEFGITDKMDALNEKQAWVFRQIENLIWGVEGNRKDALVKFFQNEKTGALEIVVETIDEQLSFELCNSLYYTVEASFLEVYANQNFKIKSYINNKVDSLQNELKLLNNQIASFDEKNRQLISKSIISEKEFLRQKQYAVNTAFAEMVKNKEVNALSSVSKNQLFKIIDQPYIPLPVKKPSIITFLLKWIVISGFLSFLLVLLIDVYQRS
jgi:hypothetical protein